MAMQRYIDRDNDSGVAAYDVGPGWIHVQFKDGAIYEYTDASAGAAAISTMQALAASGDGLNAYINRHVKKGYSRRIR